jgi:Uma2 family endonuclease
MLGDMSRESDPKTEEAPLGPLPFRPPPKGSELPTDDGEPMESERHRRQMNLLIDTLEGGWEGPKSLYVGGNMALYFSELQAKNNDFRAPDVFVVLDVDGHERRSWVVWEEDGRTPDVIIELLSEHTEQVDRGEKMRVYARVLKVANYYLFDPFTHALEGYELDTRTKDYRRIAPSDSGRVPCAPLGLELGLWEGEYAGTRIPWLRWFRKDGSVLELTETTRAAREARRADEEARRADEEARRADEEARRADEEARRADEGARRADEEAKRAKELAADLARYRARFGDLDDR